MKKILAAGLMLASLNAFSQSYLVLQNGITLTTDKSGFVYDFAHFRLPYKVTIQGQNFLVEDKKLSTVDVNGFLYEKNNLKVEKIRGKGGNFFINDDNHLFTIDANGFFYKFDKEEKVFRKTIAYGSNYFLVKPDDKRPPVDLYTVNDKGNYFKINVPGLNPADIVATSGTFFQTRAGVTYTVSKDGFVFSKEDMRIGAIQKAGGNYFLDANNLLYTVTEDGLVVLPVLPANIRIAEIKNYGANYMIDSEGRIFVVDRAGNITERTVSHDLRNVKILSL